MSPLLAWLVWGGILAIGAHELGKAHARLGPAGRHLPASCPYCSIPSGCPCARVNASLEAKRIARLAEAQPTVFCPPPGWNPCAGLAAECPEFACGASGQCVKTIQPTRGQAIVSVRSGVWLYTDGVGAELVRRHLQEGE